MHCGLINGTILTCFLTAILTYCLNILVSTTWKKAVAKLHSIDFAGQGAVQDVQAAESAADQVPAGHEGCRGDGAAVDETMREIHAVSRVPNVEGSVESSRFKMKEV